MREPPRVWKVRPGKAKVLTGERKEAKSEGRSCSADLYGAGDSQGYFDGGVADVGKTPEESNMLTTGVFGTSSLLDEAELFWEYMESLPDVDTDHLIASGHSMGCVAAFKVGAKHDAETIIGASPAGMVNMEHEGYDEWNTYDGNIAVMFGDVEVAPIGKKDPHADALGMLKHYSEYADATEVNLGEVYGSFEDGNGFVYVVESNRVHEAAFVDTETVGNILKYAQMGTGDAVPSYIDSNDQVWPLKDYTGLFGTFAWLAFVLATALLLIEEVPAFAVVRRPLPRNIGIHGPVLVGMSIFTLLVPYVVIKTDAFGIVGGQYASNLWNVGFRLDYSNMGFGVIIGLAIVCLIGAIVFILTERKKKLTADDFGLMPADYDTAGSKAKQVLNMVFKTLLVSLIAVGVGFAYTQLQLTVLGTDFYSFYSWFFGVKDLPISKIPDYLPYLGVFILAFFVLSIDMNVIRRLPTTGNETKDLIIAMAVNLVIGVTVVIVIVAVKWYLQSMGSPADSNWLWGMGLDTQRIWGMPVGMTCAVLGSTLIYKKTGNLWLCALLVGTIACIMGVLYGGTRFHYLTFYC